MLELSAPALFLAGVAASPHCGLMCGPLQALQLRGPSPASRAMGWLHLGRVAGYTTLGALAGGLGHGLLPVLPADRAGLWIQITAALILVLLGLSYLRRTRSASCAVHQSQSSCTALSGLGRGMLWALLPCGALYAMLFLAAASADSWSGALLMAAFGLGTVPLLAASGMALSRLRLHSRLRLLTAVTLMALGLASMTFLLNSPAGSLWCHWPS